MTDHDETFMKLALSDREYQEWKWQTRLEGILAHIEHREAVPVTVVEIKNKNYAI